VPTSWKLELTDNCKTNFQVPPLKISKEWLLSSQKEILCWPVLFLPSLRLLFGNCSLLFSTSVHCWWRLLVGTSLHVYYTKNEMCAKNNIYLYVVQTSNNRVSMACDFYCCLLPQCGALHSWHLGLQFATQWESCGEHFFIETWMFQECFCKVWTMLGRLYQFIKIDNLPLRKRSTQFLYSFVLAGMLTY